METQEEPRATDPETEEAAELAARAAEDEVTEVALDQAGGPQPDTGEQPSEHTLSADDLAAAGPVEEALEAEAEPEPEVPPAGPEEDSMLQTEVEETLLADIVDAEVDVPVSAEAFSPTDGYVQAEEPPAEEAEEAEAEEPEAEKAVEAEEAEAEEAPIADVAERAESAGETVEVEEVKIADVAVETEEAEVAPASSFDGPGEWYVIHTYAGYENKVKANLHSRIGSMQMEEKIFDVVIPMEDVMEIKGGKKQVVQKKVFPGYLLVKMIYDNDSWYVVRNTPGVTGFVSSGTGTKPTPLSRREVEKILAVKQETQVKPQYRLEWEEGDVVRIIAGPFADFTGTIAEINVEQSKLKVLVNIFDRETPVELAFDQVAKA